jgi:hypothetical protein
MLQQRSASSLRYGRTSTSEQLDRQATRSVLSERANRYVARHMCWVLTISG